ncbi:MAG: hypothetical protein EOM87_07015 [Clostridia bacterium]|nr:hypothetical protein [Clostridia bacterium]
MQLYGDGLHDDTAAIQERIDSSKVFELPVPENFYLISKPLCVHSDFVFKADANTVIRLAPNSDCMMLCGNHLKNVVINGGKWDMQNTLQAPNPLVTYTYGQIKHDDMDDRYLGVAMRFFDISNFTFKNSTLRNPVTFGVQLTKIFQFTIDSITFDYDVGNPILGTMDGVHLESGCSFGRITNLKGKTFDDLLAINADDFYYGDITDIAVDGIFSDGGHSAIRFLSSGSNVKRISVQNIFGTFYQYCIGITKYYFLGDKTKRGQYDMISIRNIYASKHYRYPDFYTPESYVYPLIYIEKELDIRNLLISELHRREDETDVETIFVDSDTVIENLCIENCSYENKVGNAPFLVNRGQIKQLKTDNINLYGDNIRFM